MTQPRRHLNTLYVSEEESLSTKLQHLAEHK